LVFAVVDPIRTALKAGSAADALVREIVVRPFDAPREDGDAPMVVPKRPPLALFAALVFPVGGGHHYAEHHFIARSLTVGIVLSAIAATVWPESIVATLVLIASDLVRAPDAVRRRNAGQIASTEEQQKEVWWMFAGALAMALLYGLA
jgi:hypothetical protein